MLLNCLLFRYYDSNIKLFFIASHHFSALFQLFQAMAKSFSLQSRLWIYHFVNYVWKQSEVIHFLSVWFHMEWPITNSLNNIFSFVKCFTLFKMTLIKKVSCMVSYHVEPLDFLWSFIAKPNLLYDKFPFTSLLLMLNALLRSKWHKLIIIII